MAVLEKDRREAYAQARAAGASVNKAYVQAGYVLGHGNGWRVERNEVVMARVAEIQTKAISETRNLEPLINRMVQLSAEAAALKSAAGIREAKDLLVEAARLKGLLPAPVTPPMPRMSREEWLAKYGPS